LQQKGAIEKLDEFDNADYAQIFKLHDFLVDFTLTNEGILELKLQDWKQGPSA
jgi:hypothetical protein